MNWTKFDRGVFLVNCLGIIHKDGKILIGRRDKDPHIKELTWCFPGGRPSYKHSLARYLREEVKKKTNLDIEVVGLIHARSVLEKPEFLSLYFICDVIRTGKKQKEKPGEKFLELKWIKPTDVKKYFTTSIDPMIMQFLTDLEKGDI